MRHLRDHVVRRNVHLSSSSSVSSPVGILQTRSQLKQKFRRARRARHDVTHRLSVYRALHLPRRLVVRRAPGAHIIAAALPLVVKMCLSLFPRLQRLLRLAFHLFEFRERSLFKALPAASLQRTNRWRRSKPNNSRRWHVISSNERVLILSVLPAVRVSVS